MALARKSIQDFIAQIAARTPGIQSGATYSASLNSDGTVAVSKNGTVIFSKVWWNMGAPEAVTDVNISGDSVDVLMADQAVGQTDGQSFINSLT